MTKPSAPRNRFLKLLGAVVLPMILGAVIATAILYVPRPGWTTNDVTTGSAPGYPDLISHRYDSSPTNTLAYASAAATGIKRWKVIGRDENTGTLHATVQSVIPVFTDDVTVTVVPIGEDKNSSEVVIRSHSRVGTGDLGENYRHIRALQGVMDERLPALP